MNCSANWSPASPDRNPRHASGLVGVVGEDERAEAGRRDLRRVAADVGAVRAHDVELVAHGRRATADVAHVGVLRDERSVRFSPLPPIMIGGPPAWIGFGTFARVAVLSRSGRRTSAVRRAARGRSGPLPRAGRAVRRARGNRSRSPSCSTSYHAAPMPRIARPCEITSSVVTILASSAGLRYVTPVTSVPSCTRSVRPRARRAACTPRGSVRPDRRAGSCQKWSITHTDANPLSSAATPRERVVEHLRVRARPRAETPESETRMSSCRGRYPRFPPTVGHGIGPATPVFRATVPRGGWVIAGGGGARRLRRGCRRCGRARLRSRRSRRRESRTRRRDEAVARRRRSARCRRSRRRPDQRCRGAAPERGLAEQQAPIGAATTMSAGTIGNPDATRRRANVEGARPHPTGAERERSRARSPRPRPGSSRARSPRSSSPGSRSIRSRGTVERARAPCPCRARRRSTS